MDKPMLNSERKRIIDFLKEKGCFIAAVILLAATVTLLCASELSSWIYAHAKTEVVTFSVYGEGNGIPLRIVNNSLCYTDDNAAAPYDQWKALKNDENSDGLSVLSQGEYWYSSQQMQDQVVENRGFQIYEEEQAGETQIVFEAEKGTESLSVEMPIHPSTCISVERNGTGFGLVIQRSGNPEGDWIGPTSFENKEQSFSQKLYFYDVEDYAYLLGYYIAGYCAIFGLIFTATLAGVWFVKRVWSAVVKTGFLCGSHPVRMFSLVLVISTLYFWAVYASSPETFHVNGAADPYYYGYPELQESFLDQEGKFSFELFIQNGWTHRSYLPMLIYYILNRIAELFAWDEKYLHMVVNSLFLSTAVAAAFPTAIRALFDRKAKDGEMLAFGLIFSFFWKGHLFYELTDMSGATMALLALGAGGMLARKVTYRRALVFGAASAVAIAYRAAYFIMFELGLVALILVLFWKLMHSKQKKRALKQMAAGLILTIAAFVVVLLPQGYINYQRGHWGLMPYSGVASYNLAKNDLDKSQWGSMKGYQFAGGYYLDRQMNSIVEPYFSLDVNPAQADLPFIVAASPIPFVEGLIKRLLYALSVYQEPVCLFLVSNRSDIADALQYLTHFFLLANVIYYGMVRRCHSFPRAMKGALAFAFVFQVLSQVALFQIERRFYMLFFMLVYAANVCCIPGCWKEDLVLSGAQAQSRQGKYLAFVTVFHVLAYTALETILFNFAK